MKKAISLTTAVLALFWNIISFLGSFYFPFFSPAYAQNETALRLKELWYYFVPGDFLLFTSIFLTIYSLFKLKDAETSGRLLILSGVLSAVKGLANTFFYVKFFGSLTPSFLNIFSGFLLIFSGVLFSKSVD